MVLYSYVSRITRSRVSRIPRHLYQVQNPSHISNIHASPNKLLSYCIIFFLSPSTLFRHPIFPVGHKQKIKNKPMPWTVKHLDEPHTSTCLMISQSWDVEVLHSVMTLAYFCMKWNYYNNLINLFWIQLERIVQINSEWGNLLSNSGCRDTT
jgi:hypothetical protein